MSKNTKVVFNYKRYESLADAYRSIENIPGVISYDQFLSIKPKTLSHCFTEEQLEQLQPVHVEPVEKDYEYLTIFINIIRELDPTGIPSENNFETAKYIIKNLGAQNNLDDAEAKLLAAAKLEIQNYTSRIVKSR